MLHQNHKIDPLLVTGRGFIVLLVDLLRAIVKKGGNGRWELCEHNFTVIVDKFKTRKVIWSQVTN